MNSLKGISVVVCCYNSADRICKTLHYLSYQQACDNFLYEIILVDNNCSDNTIETAEKFWKSAGSPFLLKVVQQPVSGLNFARQKGVDTACFEYIIFCDDDNGLCENYLKRVIDLFEYQHDVAIIGGVGEPEFQCTPPSWFDELKGFGYAIGTEGRTTGYVDLVYGAGMGIRRSIFQKVVSSCESFVLTDRIGNALSSGGDAEICILTSRAGFKIYLDTNLCFKHFIAASRLKWSYYLRLRKAFGIAAAYLEIYKKNSELPLNRGMAGNVKAIISYGRFLIFRVHFYLFPGLFKNAECASFMQALSTKKTILINYTRIRSLSKRVN